ncbi:MAG: phospholipid/cholesterol/gamma-HCH transport system substrate-binding protein, partial [Actinomycetota bacterium]|nr:phospholipid/cholesterol/gamma-HCH transport system substrate-binding protein [Actinomycetota bacterium]
LMSSCAALGFETACNGTEIIGKFEQVGDLVENANVQSSDVRVGTIKKIELDGWEAQVTMCLNPGEKIPDDVIAVVRTTSLLGEKFVDLQTQSEGGPFLEDGAILESDQTSKATELEEIFAKLAGVLGTGNLEQINRFTSSQAKILSDHADELRDVLLDLRDFTDLLADRKSEIAGAVDHLDSVAATLIQQTPVLQRFLRSFAESSGVLADNKNGLRTLLFSLDRFTKISVQLLAATDNGLNKQFQDLRPVLDTLVANSANLRKTLTTLAAFSRYWPESMPGDYLQLDVCLAGAEDFDAGDNCPQSDGGGVGSAGSSTEELPANGTEMILMRPLAGGR